MFERFTDRAREVMKLANEQAEQSNPKYINTEHILLGLLKEGSGVGAAALKNLGIDIKKLYMEVEKKLTPIGTDAVSAEKYPPTPLAIKVIEYSIEEARALNHKYIGTEHILLSLFRVTDGVAAQVLMDSGLKIENVRKEILNILAAAQSQKNKTP